MAEEKLKKEEKQLKKEVETLAEAKQKTATDKDLETIEERYLKLKEANDKVASELMRQEELKAKVSIAGNTDAGEPDKTPEEQTEEEAKNILSMYQQDK